MKWTTDTFKERLEVISPNIEILSEYEKSSIKVKCLCKKCGYQWMATPNKLLMGRGCVKCYRIRRADADRITKDEFYRRMKINAPNIEVLDDFVNFQTAIKCKCNICGYEWTTMPGRVSKGVTCSLCANNIRRTTEKFVDEMSAINPNIEILGEYTNNHSKILCRCKLCNNQWKSIPSRLLHGHGCSSCAHSGTSFVEQFILKAFRYVIKDVISRDKDEIGKELDIYIPALKLAIEPGAWDIHRKKIKTDEEKIKLCNEKEIRLITIYFLCRDARHNIMNNPDVYWYREDLALEQNIPKLVNLIYELFSIFKIEKVFSEMEIAEIKNYAYIQSRKITPDEFRERINMISPDIEIIGRYNSTKSKVSCRCRICGYEWEGNPANLLKGSGCLKCSGNMKKTTEDFRKELFVITDKIEVIGDYVTAHEKIKCKCKKCNTEWLAIPHTLLKGHGCPNCYNKKRGNSQRMTTEQFVEKLSKITNNIIILGEYQNTHTSIKCECKKCGCIFRKTPHDLLDGQGCPWCAGRKNSKLILVSPS